MTYRSKFPHTKITVTGQGNLVTITLTTPLTKRRCYSLKTRAAIRSFSRKSRLRFMRLMARLAFSDSVFVTLTYGQKFPTVAEAKLHLREFCRRLSRTYNKSAFVWRQELQQRGAIHFHLIITRTKYIPKNDIMLTWASVIGNEYCDFTETLNGREGPARPPFTRIEQVRSRKKLTNYVSKYLAKVSGGDASGFNDVPYLHTVLGEVVSVGRQWGIYCRANLIFAIAVSVTLVYGDWYRHMANAMGDVWAYCHRAIYRDTGFSLFTDKAIRWVEKAMNYYSLYSFDDGYDEWS